MSSDGPNQVKVLNLGAVRLELDISQGEWYSGTLGHGKGSKKKFFSPLGRALVPPAAW